MTAWRNILILLTFIGGLASNDQPGQAYPSDPAARQDVSAVEDGGEPISLPVDPVIEEPLRPLYPPGGAFPSDATPRCGSMSLAIPAFMLLCMHVVRIRPAREPA